MSTTCPTPGPLMFGISKEQRKGRVFRPPCGRWSCPVCGEENAKTWGFIAFYGAHEMMKDQIGLMFITLTSHEKLSAEQTLSAWPSAWKKLHTRLNREYGKGEYFMVPEKHKNGRVHFHAIVSWQVEKRWLKNAARECGLGYQVDAQVLEHAPAALAYVTKYLAKGGHIWPKGWRRVRISRGWPKPQVETERLDGWDHWSIDRLDRTEVLNIIAGHESAGYVVKVQPGAVELCRG